jgi:hypothetical protein
MLRSQVGALAVIASLCSACGGDSTGSGEHHEGSFTGSFIETFVSQGNQGGGTITCRYTINVTGTVELKLDAPGGSATGDGKISWTERPAVVAIDKPPGCSEYSQGGAARSFDTSGELSGTADQLHFSGGYTTPATSGQPMTVVTTASFTGTAGSGKVSLSRTGSGTVTSQLANGTTQVTTTQSSVSGSFDVTLD